jgi:flagellar hook-associated protein 2
MRINNSFNSNISNLFNTLHQGKVAIHANKLSNSSVLFPQNTAPGQGSMGSGALQYVNDIKSAASNLSGALNNLSGSAFSQRTMVSSNTDVMTVNFTGNSSSLNTMGDMSVRIDQIAAGQVNEGTRQNASSLYGGERGTNRFAIETGGRTTNLSINVMAGDSNRDVQQKMATAINNAGLGLRATVENDSQTGTSMLRVESTNVGTAERNAFSITDITGNAAAQTGANNVARERQDAIFSVNGGPTRTSQSNTVDLGNGVSATFRAASEQDVRITRGQDLNRATSAVRDMVSSFNSLFSAAAQNTSDPRAQGLASRMMNVSSAYSRSLQDIGIGFDNSGRMTINSDRLNQAAESGRLEQFFTQSAGRNFGFSAQLGRLADNVSRNTSNFVSNSIFGNSLSENFAYSGGGNTTQFNALNSGSIFDFKF